MHNKTSKQTIIISLLVIVFCIVCLTGATFALFTNDLEDGTIGITTTSGNVKVDLIDTSVDDPKSLVGKTLEFQTSTINKEILFEPGAKFYTQGFKVKNAGNIPIKYRLSVSEDPRINMVEFLKTFEIWITKDKNNPDNGEKLIKFEGTLEAGACSETYYLFIKMKETINNDFQGKTYEGIGVNVYAVQGNGSLDE